jgi:ketosteroid isomerase-like protein
MSVTNMNANSELTVRHELQAAMREPVVSRCDDESTPVNAPQWILRSVLAALSEGRISEAVAQFDERFKFNDHALALEFTDKTRLKEFLEKSRELFPDTTLEVVSILESGDYAFAEWRLAATQTVPYGSISCRFPVSSRGATKIRVEKGRIAEWSDYYDQSSSRRVNLAAFFTEWIEY